jgi:hypothetical protein
MDHEDNSHPVNNYRTQERERERERERKTFILPLTGAYAPDLSKKTACSQM